MGRIGHKAPLAFGLGVDQCKQAIERAHQRTDFGRRAVLRDGTEVARRAPLDGLGKSQKRPESPADRPVDGNAGIRDQQHAGQQHMQQQLAHPLLAHITAIGQHQHHFTGAIGFGAHDGHAVGQAVMLLAVELGQRRGRHVEADPGVAGNDMALQIADGISDVVAALAQDVLDGGRQRHQGRRSLGDRRRQHRIGQRRQQAQKALVMLVEASSAER